MQTFSALSRRGQLQRLSHMAQAALQQYGLLPLRIAPLKHEHNTTFRVWGDDGQRYVLRIHRPGQHSLAAIRSELLWLQALCQETGLNVPQPVATKAGDLLTVVEADGVPEARICVLLRWLEGRFINERLTPTHLERVGIFTAHLHEYTAQWQPPAEFVRGRVDNVTAEARRVSRVDAQTTLSQLNRHPAEEDVERTLRLVTNLCSSEDAVWVQRAIDQIRQAQTDLGYDKTVFGLIHADMHQENYFFAAGQVCAIDFDDCGYGHYLFDLNVTLLEVQYLPQYPALRPALLSGYRQVRPLPVAHEAYLSAFFALRHLQLLVWVLESREHPAFRDGWQEWSQEELQNMKQVLQEKC